MRHLDLFSGIGGFSYAADQVWEDVEHIFCDNEPFARHVLRKHWPHAEIYEDIRHLEGSSIGTVDLVTGGFPCQPFSAVGKREGQSDDRYLWPEMLRLIRDCKPEWVIAENVYGLTTLQDGLVFEEVLSSLEATGYEVQPFVIPAIATDAPHRRDRVWIVANAKSQRPTEVDEEQQERRPGEHTQGFDAFWGLCSTLPMVMEPDFTRPSSGIRRNDDGLSEGMDRLKALGNAIVPQVAMQIMRAIKEG